MTQTKKMSYKTGHYPFFSLKMRHFGYKSPRNRVKTLPTVAIHGGNFYPKKFTGKERDSETGLYYYGARYLDSRTSRWLSGDPAMGDYVPEAPVNDEARKRNGNLPGQGGVFNYVNLHVYHYAGNNPVKYTDPDGEALNLALAALGAVAGGTIAAVVSVKAGSDIKDTFINVGIGMAGGVVAGAALSVGQSAAAGATISAVSNVVTQRTTGSGEVDVAQVIVASGLGALGGAGGAAIGKSVATSLAAPSIGVSTTTAAEVGGLVNTTFTTLTSGLSGAVTSLMDIDK